MILVSGGHAHKLFFATDERIQIRKLRPVNLDQWA